MSEKQRPKKRQRQKETLVQKMARTLSRERGWPPASQYCLPQRALILRFSRLLRAWHRPKTEPGDVE